MTVEEGIKELNSRREKAKQMGGEGTNGFTPEMPVTKIKTVSITSSTG